MTNKVKSILTGWITIIMLTLASFTSFASDHMEGNITKEVPSQTFISIYNEMLENPDRYKVTSIDNQDITEEFKLTYLNQNNLIGAWQYVYDNVSNITGSLEQPMTLSDVFTSQEAIYDILRCQKSGAAFEICFYLSFEYEVNANNKIIRSTYPQISEWLSNPFDLSEFDYTIRTIQNSYSINTSQTTIVYTYNYTVDCTVLTTEGLYFEYDFPVYYHSFPRRV